MTLDDNAVAGGESDMRLFSIVDTAEEAVALLQDFYRGRPPLSLSFMRAVEQKRAQR